MVGPSGQTGVTAPARADLVSLHVTARAQTHFHSMEVKDVSVHLWTAMPATEPAPYTETGASGAHGASVQKRAMAVRADASVSVTTRRRPLMATLALERLSS